VEGFEANAPDGRTAYGVKRDITILKNNSQVIVALDAQ
jgi:hypothetical protein